MTRDDPYTTVIDVQGFEEVRGAALKAHATQVDPNSPFWFGLPANVLEEIQPVDQFRLAQSRVGPRRHRRRAVWSRTTCSTACADGWRHLGRRPVRRQRAVAVYRRRSGSTMRSRRRGFENPEATNGAVRLCSVSVSCPEVR